MLDEEKIALGPLNKMQEIAENEIPSLSIDNDTDSDNKKNRPKHDKTTIPLYGLYGDVFLNSNPSPELLEKEQERFFESKDGYSTELAAIENGLCKKYHITPPEKKPNRMRDRWNTNPDHLLCLGETVNDRRNPKMWGITQDDLTRHLYCLGPSGSGKSTLLSSFVIQDMWYWRGGLLMEPHGDLCLNCLYSAPPYRIHDIVYLNLLDPEYAPGFNPLELPLNASDQERSEAQGAVESLIAKHFSMETGNVLLRKMLANALIALSWCPGATVLEIMDFYNNPEIQNSVLSFMPDGAQKDNVQSIAANAKADNLASLENRISQFHNNRSMKHMFGQSHTTVDFYSLMNQGAFIICPIPKGATQDDTFVKFCGNYIVSQIYKNSLMREMIPEDNRVIFPLIMDEFQNFITGDIGQMLAELRKYGLPMMFAHQYLSQLDGSTKDAIIQNTATKLVYNLQAPDAKELQAVFGLPARDLMNIPKYTLMCMPTIKGNKTMPFLSKVNRISNATESTEITARLIIEESRNKYMKKRDDIEKEILERKERLASGNKDAIIEMVTRKNR